MTKHLKVKVKSGPPGPDDVSLGALSGRSRIFEPITPESLLDEHEQQQSLRYFSDLGLGAPPTAEIARWKPDAS